MKSEPSIYQLYASPNTYSIGAHLLLEESGVPYRIINPRLNPSQTDEAFHQVSPHGRVPALTLPGGTSIIESSAIALHLADSLCDKQFSIDYESEERAPYLQWLFYLSSTLQPDVMLVFHPEYYFADKAQQSALVEAARKRLTNVWQVLEKQYSTKSHSAPWMFKSGPTALDFSLAPVLMWPECFPTSSNEYPALGAMLSELSERTSFKRIMPWHQRKTDDPPQRMTAGS